MNRTEREEKIRHVAELLPRAREEVLALVGDYRRVQAQLDALSAAVASGRDIDDQAIRDAARAFGAFPALVAPQTKAFRIETSDVAEEADKPALRDLGQLVVALASESDD